MKIVVIILGMILLSASPGLARRASHAVDQAVLDAQDDFFDAAGDMDFGIARMAAYLGAGGDINAVDDEGINAFMWAVDVNAYANAAWLLDRGINLAATNLAGKTCLMYMAVAGERAYPLLQRMLSKREVLETLSYVTYDTGATALMMASEHRKQRAYDLLLSVARLTGY